MLHNPSKSHSHQADLLGPHPGVLNPSLAFRPSSLHDHLCPLVWKRKSRGAWLSEDQGSQGPENKLKWSRTRPMLQDAVFTGSSYLGQSKQGLYSLSEWPVSASQRTSVGLEEPRRLQPLPSWELLHTLILRGNDRSVSAYSLWA